MSSFFVLDFAGNLRVRKTNKAQTNRAHITGVRYYPGLWSCLRAHQQEWCQLCPIIHPLFITLPHNFHRLHSSPPPPAEYVAPPGFGRDWKIIWPLQTPDRRNGADTTRTTYPAAANLSASRRASRDASIISPRRLQLRTPPLPTLAIIFQASIVSGNWQCILLFIIIIYFLFLCPQCKRRWAETAGVSSLPTPLQEDPPIPLMLSPSPPSLRLQQPQPPPPIRPVDLSAAVLHHFWSYLTCSTDGSLSPTSDDWSIQIVFMWSSRRGDFNIPLIITHCWSNV